MTTPNCKQLLDLIMMKLTTLVTGSAARLRVLRNGDSDELRAVIVVGPDLTNVSWPRD